MLDRDHRADKFWSTFFLGFLISTTDRRISSHRYSLSDPFRKDSCNNRFFTRYPLFPFDDRCEDEIHVRTLSEFSIRVAYSRSKCRKELAYNDICISIFRYPISLRIEKSLDARRSFEKGKIFLIVSKTIVKYEDKITRILDNILSIEIVIDIITIPAGKYRDRQISK